MKGRWQVTYRGGEAAGDDKTIKMKTSGYKMKLLANVLNAKFFIFLNVKQIIQVDSETR